MRQTVPWSVKGVGPDARETAKELARRSGMTLGQWLNAMIAEQTAEQQEAEEEAASPLASLAARLNELTRRGAATAPAALRDVAGETGREPQITIERLRATENQTAGILEQIVRRSAETEARTTQLIETLVRTNRETETKTANALAAVAKWIEAAERAPKAEAPRGPDPETLGAIRAISARLDQIETKLPAIDEAVARPIRTAIDRLDSRLASLSEQAPPAASQQDLTRTAADLERRLAVLADKLAAEPAPAARRNVEPRTAEQESAEQAAHAARIESKLSRILSTLSDHKDAGQAITPPAATVKPQRAASLDEAIEQISHRQRGLDGAERALAMPTWPPRPLRTQPDPAIAAGLDGIKSHIADLTREIAELRKASRPQPQPQPQPPRPEADPAIRALREEIATVSRSLTTLASAGGVDAVGAQMARLAERVEDLRRSGVSEFALRSVESQLEQIAGDLSRLAMPDISGLERELRQISAKLDRLTTRGPDAPALEMLHRQVERMAAMAAPDTSRLESDLKQISGKLDRLAARGPDSSTVETLHRQVERMAAMSAPDTSRFEGDLKQISAKLDRIAAQGVDPTSLERLSRRVEEIGLSGPAPAASLDLSADPTMKALRADVADVSRSLFALASASGLDAVETRVSELSERIGGLRLAGASENQLELIERQLADIGDGLSRLAVPDVTAVQDDLKLVAAKLDRVAEGIGPGALQSLHRRTEEIRDLVSQGMRPDVIETLTRRIDDLTLRLDRAPVAAPVSLPAGDATAPLEAMIAQLADKLDQAQRPGADDRSLEMLEGQITRLAERLENQATAVPDLSGIEHTLSGLYSQLTEMRAAALDAADDAASRAVRQAVAHFPTVAPSPAGFDGAGAEGGVQRHLEEIRAAQDNFGRRTELTLGAVQSTLERLAQRMSQLEQDGPRPAAEAMPAFAAAMRRAGEPAAARDVSPGLDAQPRPDAPRPPIEPDLSLDLPLEPGSGAPRGLKAPPQAAPDSLSRPAAIPSASSTSSAADPKSFIQAARRAAQAAALEAASLSRGAKAEPAGGADIGPPTIDPLDRPAAEPAGRARSFRIGLAPVGDLTRRNKRAILLGLAAVVVALGAFQVKDLVLPAGESPAPATAPAIEQAAPADPAPGPAAGADAAQPAPAAGPQPPEAAPATPAGSDARPADAPPPAGEPAPAAKPSASRSLDPAAEAAGAPAPTSLEAAMQPNGGFSQVQPLSSNTLVPPQLEKAATAGDPRALFDLANRLAVANGAEGDLRLAAQFYQKAADKGFAPALYRLGSMYEKGLGVKKDTAKAQSLYQSAADQGNVKAMHNLAVLYAEGGVGGKPDYANAAQWFRQAAEHGLRDSEYNYAILVARGLGSSPDLPEAYKWFGLAANQGDDDAAKKRDDVGRRLDAATLKRQKAEITGFKPLTAPMLANEATLPEVSWSGGDKGGA